MSYADNGKGDGKKDGPVEMERFHLALFVLAFGSRFFGK